MVKHCLAILEGIEKPEWESKSVKLCMPKVDAGVVAQLLRCQVLKY